LNSTNWKHVAESIGIAAIVASLIFVGMQLRQDRNATLSGSSQSGASSYIDLQIAIAEHANLLTKSNIGEDLTDSELTALNALVRGLHRQAVTDVLERRRLGGGADIPQAIFASWLHRNPGAKEVWRRQGAEKVEDVGQLTDDEGVFRLFYEEVEEALDKLENSGI
jgi:hypothetical protein